MSAQVRLPSPDSRFVLGTAAFVVLALGALLFRIGADSQWLAALGRVIIAQHAVPAGIPFAQASTAHWPNTLVLGELIFAGLENAFGNAGLMLAQLLAVAVALAVLARDAQAAGARRLGVAAALLLCGVGALPSLAIARAQLFSLALFPVLAMLLRSEARRPSRAIWWVVPLLALWTNLHGAALLGAGLLAAYLLFDRGRRAPRESLTVGVAAGVALFATPAGLGTFDYYRGVMTNVAAQRGAGMWGPFSLSAPLDIVLGLCAAWLLYRAWQARPARWEILTALVLAALTVKADRNGVWLLMFVCVPAARRLAPERALPALAPVAAALGAVALIAGLARGPVVSGASQALVTQAVRSAQGSPVLADGAIDEQVALAGGRIWAGNPIDAFSHRVQATYLDWLAGSASGEAAVTRAVRVVVVSRGSETQALMARTPGFVAAGQDGLAVLYVRRG